MAEGKPTQKIDKLVWLDLEMTGLDVENDKIIEVAILVTTPKMEIVDEEGFRMVVGIDQSDADSMKKIVREMHEENGLLEEALASEISLAEAESAALKYISEFVEPECAPLCGNSIATDRAFLMVHMKRFESYLHYRNIDASTLKQLYAIFDPEKKYKKPDGNHRALDDIRESIKEMQYYVGEMFSSDQ